MAQSTVPAAETTDVDARAREVEQQLTDDERFALIVGLMGQLEGFVPVRDSRIPRGTPVSAACTPGVPRLGVPALRMSDASMGVTNPGYPGHEGDTATAMPAAIALGASFNPELARRSGEAIGREARSRGFNVQLAGGNNPARDPRNGRTFAYFSEDPWHSAVMAAATVTGIQEQGVISTLKHSCLNCNETNQHWLDAVIDPAAHRESDLLAFQIATERSAPGAILGSYNMVNGELDFPARGSDGFVEPLAQAYAEGRFPKERLSEMVRRILRSMYAVGVDRWGEPPTVDPAAHNEISLETARQGIVLLSNDGVLPLPEETASVAVIGGYAQLGVVSGTGSGAAHPEGGYASVIPIGGAGPMGGARNLFLLPSSPLAELRRLLPHARVDFDPGQNPDEAALLAKRCDVAVVFGIRSEGESYDLTDLSLPWGRDELVDAVAAANPDTVVVLETGDPVAMAWHDRVRAIVQAWYPGQAGGQAIAEVLTGAVNPSGRLPVTFPADLAQTPRPELPGMGTPPRYAFGHGLSYTAFGYRDLHVEGGETVTVSVTVENTGERAGADVVQFYLTRAAGRPLLRLLGFERVLLHPGESRRVRLKPDRRLLAHFDGAAGQWRVDGGAYTVAVGAASDALDLTADTALSAARFGR